MSRSNLLPDGSCTDDIDEYVDSWRALGRKVGGVLGADAYGFDPGFLFQRGRGSPCFNMDTDTALAIAKLVDERDALRKELEERNEVAQPKPEREVRLQKKTKPKI